VTTFVFDVLYVDGVDPLATPLEEPVATLAEIASQLRIPSVFISEGTRLRPDKVAAETDTVDDLPSDEFRRSHRSSPLNPTELGDPMFSDSKAFSSFSVDDLERAKDFYGETLGLEVVETPEGLELRLAGGTSVFVYPSTNYTPPKHTILNFPVEDVEAAVDELARRGVVMEQYDLPEIKTDEKGIFRGSSGPRSIAWFKDPAGHVLSVLELDGR
jgi:catechol 2,3-dioxygenase-like lactoylglutathione lyase family enzyme